VTEKIRVADLPEFDMADYLEDEQAIAEYLTIVLEENDPAALIQALGTVARVRGMTEIAKTSQAALEAFNKAVA
jgi:probable addiction module antidote protein